MKRLALRLAILALVLLGLPGAPAAAQDIPGVALTVGQGSYRSLPPVQAAGEDAALVRAGLRNAGMPARGVADVDATTLRAQVAALAAATPAGGGAFLYFRGHVVQAPARNRADGIDNWLLGIDEAGPTAASLSLGDLLALLNTAGVARQVIVLDGAPPLPGRAVGFAAPSARSLRRSVILLGSAPGEAPAGQAGLASALARELGDSNAPAGQLMLRVAGRVETRTAGGQRPLVAGSGASAQWVMNPKAVPPPPDPDEPDVAMVKRYREAIACATQACLAAGANAVRGDLRRDLERRLADITRIDDFDPGAAATTRPRANLGAAQQAVIAAVAAEPWGRYRVGLWFLRGTAPLPQDDELAYTWLTEAAKRGDGPAGADASAEWYRRKAEFVLGWFHHSGRAPVRRDPARALLLWGGKYPDRATDPDTAWYLASYTERCIAGANRCQPTTAQALYAQARAGGVTRARSPLDPDFPEEAPK